MIGRNQTATNIGQEMRDTAKKGVGGIEVPVCLSHLLEPYIGDIFSARDI